MAQDTTIQTEKVFKKKARPFFKHASKIGICGYRKVGKTTYLTMLFEELRDHSKFQLQADDPITRSVMNNNYYLLAMQRQFLPPSIQEIPLSFQVILDKKHRFFFDSEDYAGEDVNLEQLDQKEIILFLEDADCILFFMDPDYLNDGLQLRRQQGIFCDIMRRVFVLKGRYDIPVALIITKADLIPGFKEEYINLFDPKDEHIKALDPDHIEKYVDNRYAHDPVWHKSVLKITKDLRQFFVDVTNHTVNYEVFFISPLGGVVEEEENGKKIIRPPDPTKVKPIGLDTPLRWCVQKLIERKSVRWMKRFLAIASIIILAISFGVAYGLQDNLKLLQKIEDMEVTANQNMKQISHLCQEYKKHFFTFFSEMQRYAYARECFFDFRQIEQMRKGTIEEMQSVVMACEDYLAKHPESRINNKVIQIKEKIRDEIDYRPIVLLTQELEKATTIEEHAVVITRINSTSVKPTLDLALKYVKQQAEIKSDKRCLEDAKKVCQTADIIPKKIETLHSLLQKAYGYDTKDKLQQKIDSLRLDEKGELVTSLKSELERLATLEEHKRFIEKTESIVCAERGTTSIKTELEALIKQAKIKYDEILLDMADKQVSEPGDHLRKLEKMEGMAELSYNPQNAQTIRKWKVTVWDKRGDQLFQEIEGIEKGLSPINTDQKRQQMIVAYLNFLREIPEGTAQNRRTAVQAKLGELAEKYQEAFYQKICKDWVDLRTKPSRKQTPPSIQFLNDVDVVLTDCSKLLSEIQDVQSGSSKLKENINDLKNKQNQMASFSRACKNQGSFREQVKGIEDAKRITESFLQEELELYIQKVRQEWTKCGVEQLTREINHSQRCKMAIELLQQNYSREVANIAVKSADDYLDQEKKRIDQLADQKTRVEHYKKFASDAQETLAIPSEVSNVDSALTTSFGQKNNTVQTWYTSEALSWAKAEYTNGVYLIYKDRPTQYKSISESMQRFASTHKDNVGLDSNIKKYVDQADQYVSKAQKLWSGQDYIIQFTSVPDPTEWILFYAGNEQKTLRPNQKTTFSWKPGTQVHIVCQYTRKWRETRYEPRTRTVIDYRNEQRIRRWYCCFWHGHKYETYTERVAYPRSETYYETVYDDKSEVVTTATFGLKDEDTIFKLNQPQPCNTGTLTGQVEGFDSIIPFLFTPF